MGLAVVFAGPFPWLVLAALKSKAEWVAIPPKILPEAPRWEKLHGGADRHQLSGVPGQLAVPGPDQTTLSVAIAAYYLDPHGNPDETVQAAAATFYVLPVLVIFLVAQRYFIRGVVSSGVKG